MVVAVIGLATGVGNAALLQDNFNDGNYNGWTVSDGTMTAANYYFVGTTSAGGAHTDAAYQGLSSSTNKFYTEFSIRCGVDAQGGNGYLRLQKASDSTGYGLQMNAGGNTIYFKKYNPTEYTLTSVGYTLNTSTWYNFTWTYDPDDTTEGANGSMYFYEGHGTSGTELAGFTPNWKTGGFDKCRFIDVCTETNDRHYALDKLGIYDPEPATMVLLGLGGVGLLIRRRRRA